MRYLMVIVLLLMLAGCDYDEWTYDPAAPVSPVATPDTQYDREEKRALENDLLEDWLEGLLDW